MTPYTTKNTDCLPSPLKLLYVHQAFGSLGGAEANVLITATEMRRRGHTVGLWTQRPTGRGEEGWTKTFGDNVWFLENDDLASVRAQFAPDVVYVHKWDHLPTLDAMGTSGLPLIRMVHDHDIYCLRSYRYNVFTREVCTRKASAFCVFPCLATIKRDREGPLPFKLVSYTDKRREMELNRRFHRFLVVTEYMRRELEINGFDPARIETFPPVPRAADAVRSTFSERNLLVYAGQIIRGKGVDVLLRSLAQVKSKFELVILGDGNSRADCEKLTRKLGLADRVKFAGFVPQAELNAYYRDASAVLISSVWPEPIATIGLEVMRHALPVIAFDAGGISDWLIDGHNGRLVPWSDTAAYAGAIDDLLQDKAKARRWGEAGLTLVTERYDFDRYIGNLERLFQRVQAEVYCNGTPERRIQPEPAEASREAVTAQHE
jgi:glycosyltransferase involved in cell wall biosynthesis